MFIQSWNIIKPFFLTLHLHNKVRCIGQLRYIVKDVHTYADLPWGWLSGYMGEDEGRGLTSKKKIKAQMSYGCLACGLPANELYKLNCSFL